MKKTFVRLIKKLFLMGFLALILGLAGIEMVFQYVRYQMLPFVYSVASVSYRPIGIVFGARVYQNKSMAGVTQERVETGAMLYSSKKISKLLISGDNRLAHYNEPVVMRNAAVGMGVQPKDITLDYAGFRTYDTCYRAQQIFMLKDVVLITQRLHLWRALYICRSMGLHAVGVDADTDRHNYKPSFYIRERFAMIFALIQVHITKPLPHHLGKKEPIFDQID